MCLKRLYRPDASNARYAVNCLEGEAGTIAIADRCSGLFVHVCERLQRLAYYGSRTPETMHAHTHELTAATESERIRGQTATMVAVTEWRLG